MPSWWSVTVHVNFLCCAGAETRIIHSELEAKYIHIKFPSKKVLKIDPVSQWGNVMYVIVYIRY